jgi:hypothetical protein
VHNEHRVTRFVIGLLLMMGCSGPASNDRADGAAAPDVTMPLDATSAGDVPAAADGDGSDRPADGGNGAPGNACRPACIEKVFGACAIPSTGTCVNTGTLVCFSNGVKLATTLLDAGGGQPFAEVTLFKQDGTVCGSYTNAVESDGNVLLVYYDPNGAEVARQHRVVPDASASDLVYTCDGQTYTVTSAQLGAPQCQHLQARDCPMGTCS